MTEKYDVSELEPLLTSSEVQRLLRINVTTLQRLCKQRRLPKPLKIGGSNRWRVRDIRAVLEGRNDWREENHDRDDREKCE